ncbi:cobalamin-binding protein [Rhodobacterales bacterium]|nr:cobalamin-binding protein [Rhodobacterales bacterium]
MTAKHLSGLLDKDLEDNEQYREVIHLLRDRVVHPGARLDDLLAFLHTEVLARSTADASALASTTTAIKILLVEAAARQLGKDWTSETASFIDVTIGAARFQDIAQTLSTEASAQTMDCRGPFAAILLPEGEQHSLMCYLTGALFQTMGWQQAVVAHESFRQPGVAGTVAKADVICVGWSNVRLKSNLEHLIADVRLQFPSATPPMIAGGVAALDSVAFLVEMGIDCICDSAYSAVKISENLHSLEKTIPIAAPVGSSADRIISRIDRQPR